MDFIHHGGVITSLSYLERLLLESFCSVMSSLSDMAHRLYMTSLVWSRVVIVRVEHSFSISWCEYEIWRWAYLRRALVGDRPLWPSARSKRPSVPSTLRLTLPTASTSPPLTYMSLYHLALQRSRSSSSVSMLCLPCAYLTVGSSLEVPLLIVFCRHARCSQVVSLSLVSWL